jgi:hypothetical protein
MPTNLVDALISAGERPAVMRPGVVSGAPTPTRVPVVVGGAEFQAAYLESYRNPTIGDLVACIRQDSTWLVLGKFAGTGPNQIQNPSFELSAPGTTPVNWTFQLFAGGAPATTGVTATDPNAPSGGQVARVAANAAAQDTVFLSNYIDVMPGEIYAVSCYAASFNATVATPPNDVELHACWFSTTAEAFPSPTLTTDSTLIMRVDNVPNSPPYTFMSGTVTVPSAIPTAPVAMRIGLRSINSAGVTNGGTQFDFVVCRKVN